MNNLVIVESPAKAKTIAKYLGPGYKVTASMGHLRDLPKSTLGIDINNNFKPEYVPVKGREDVIGQLKKDVAKSDKVFLATDPDREGEAISWHLKEMLGIPDDEVYRVTFNEITKNVVTESIAKPRKIDMDLVDAQQARRVLDRIVGYKLSPLLWRKIKRGLSAGRVQSVATRIVVDREDEIAAFVPDEYWLLDVILSDGTNPPFAAKYYGTAGKKKALKNEADASKVIADVENAPFTVSEIKKSEKKRSPQPPFITSTLQQEASRKLNMTPRRTMSVAQQLYEGLDISGEGAVGLITYMRTDSLRISDVALESAKKFILDSYGANYYPSKTRHFKTKSNAQDAHEAIRPSNVFITPESIRGKVTQEQYRLYKLIWSRFLACQMESAVYDSVSVGITSANHLFKCSSSVMKFKGYTAVYDDSADDTELKIPALAALNEGQLLELKEIKKEQKFTQPPTRFTESTLIKEMEETGIGRPSTYAPTISTILSREYVVKEGKNLLPTALGRVVTELMKERFSDIVDLGFTAHMEENLDEVEKGNTDWHMVISDFYSSFDTSLTNAEKALEGEHIRIPAEETEEICEVCGRKMVIKSGRFGRFLACPGYPECSFTKPIVIEMPGKCPKCGSRLLKRTSKNKYTYYACEHLSKGCDFLTWDVPVKENCPSCGQTMFKKSGKGYKKPFCINESCVSFVPEDKRGGYKKETADDTEKSAVSTKTAKTAEKKTTSKKSSATKKTTKKKSDKNEG